MLIQKNFLKANKAITQIPRSQQTPDSIALWKTEKQGIRDLQKSVTEHSLLDFLCQRSTEGTV